MANYYAARAAEYERIYHKPERQSDLARLRDVVASAFEGERDLASEVDVEFYPYFWILTYSPR